MKETMATQKKLATIEKIGIVFLIFSAIAVGLILSRLGPGKTIDIGKTAELCGGYFGAPALILCLFGRKKNWGWFKIVFYYIIMFVIVGVANARQKAMTPSEANKQVPASTTAESPAPAAPAGH